VSFDELLQVLYGAFEFRDGPDVTITQRIQFLLEFENPHNPCEVDAIGGQLLDSLEQSNISL
jgi:hypothetical protein